MWKIILISLVLPSNQRLFPFWPKPLCHYPFVKLKWYKRPSFRRNTDNSTGFLNVIFWHHHKRYIFFKDLITKKVIKVNEGLAWPTKWHHRCFYDSSSFPPKPRLHEICQWPSSDHQNIIKVGVVEVKSESIIIAKKCSTWR